MTASPARLWAARLGWIGVGAVLAISLTALTEATDSMVLRRTIVHALGLPPIVQERLRSAPRRSWGPAWIMQMPAVEGCGEGDEGGPAAEREPASVPRVVLPRMPGDNLIREQTAWDDASRSWGITQSLDVPARLALVEKFYRKALASQGFEPRGGALPEDEDGAERAMLRARLPHRHVQVSFRQPRGQLTTRVRVIWRIWSTITPENG